MTRKAARMVLLGAGASMMVGCAMFQKVEEPPYRVVNQNDKVQVREYPSMILAVTEVEGPREQSLNRGFRILADYIFGNNRDNRKVEMTAPVQQSSEGRKVEMTAPVQASGSGDRWRIAFVMPSHETMESLPTPVDARVQLVQVPPRKVAVLRFSGRSSTARMEQHASVLMQTLQAQGVQVNGQPVSAYYNPPWTPWPLRRNEVMVDVH